MGCSQTAINNGAILHTIIKEECSTNQGKHVCGFSRYELFL